MIFPAAHYVQGAEPKLYLPTDPEGGAKYFHFQNKVARQGVNFHNVIEIIRNQDRDSACSFLIMHTDLILLLFSS